MHTKENVAIMAQDYGGADYLSEYLIKNKINKKFKCHYFLSGPAVNIFKIKKLITNTYKFNFFWDKKIKKLYYALNFEKKIENYVLEKAFKKKIYSTLCLDGWCNYKKRMHFKKKGKIFFPNKINVFDKAAYKICLSLDFQRKSNLKLNKNLNLNKKYKKLKKKLKGKIKNKILYLASPEKKLNSKNFKFLKDFAKNKGMHLEIRQHPRQHNMQNEKKSYNQPTIINAIASSEYVIGHCSTALVYSALLGVKTASIQKKPYKDLFEWKEFSIYKTFNISNLNSFKDLKRI